MRKYTKPFLGVLAIGVIGCAILDIAGNEPPTKNSTGADGDKLDYTQPIFSVDGMTTCESVTAFSKIAADLGEHYTPRYTEYGCRVWPDGIKLKVISKIASYRHVEFAGLDGTRVSDFTLFTMLRNGSSEGNAGTTTGEMNSNKYAAPNSDTMPDDIKRAISKFDEANDICRDSSSDNTPAACDLRDKMMDDIKTRGWCWNVEGTIEADAKWSKCP